MVLFSINVKAHYSFRKEFHPEKQTFIIRLKSYEVRDQVMPIAAALHNLRLNFRNC